MQAWSQVRSQAVDIEAVVSGATESAAGRFFAAEANKTCRAAITSRQLPRVLPSYFHLTLRSLSDKVAEAHPKKARSLVEEQHAARPFSISFGDHVGSSQAATVAIFLAQNEVLILLYEAVLLLASECGLRENERPNEQQWQEHTEWLMSLGFLVLRT